MVLKYDEFYSFLIKYFNILAHKCKYMEQN